GHATGEVADRAFGRGVGGNARSGQLALYGSDVDDFAAAAGDHVMGHGFADVEEAADVGAHHRIPLIDGELVQGAAMLYAGVVDQDIDRPRLGFEVVDGCLRCRRIGYIEGPFLGG